MGTHTASNGISAEEAAFGFIAFTGEGEAVAITELSPGLFALKTMRDGRAEYRICGDDFVAVYRPATSLGELQRRFPKPAGMGAAPTD